MELIYNNKGILEKVLKNDVLIRKNIFYKFKRKFPFLKTFIKKKRPDVITVTDNKTIVYL